MHNIYLISQNKLATRKNVQARYLPIRNKNASQRFYFAHEFQRKRTRLKFKKCRQARDLQNPGGIYKWGDAPGNRDTIENLAKLAPIRSTRHWSLHFVAVSSEI